MDELDEAEIKNIKQELSQTPKSLLRFSYILLSFLLIMMMVSIFGIWQIERINQSEQTQDELANSNDGFGLENSVYVLILAISAIYPGLLYFWYLDQGKQKEAYLSATVFPLLGLAFVVAVSWWTDK